MTLLSKDQLWQQTADLPWEDVPLRSVPGGSPFGTMRLRGLTGEEVNEWQDQAVQQVGNKRRQSKHTMALLVIKSAINEDGSPFFDNRDVIKVSQMPSFVLTQLTKVAVKLSGLSDEDVEDLIADFDDGPSEPSISD